MQGGVFGAGVYGGYFGAAQGIILMGILGALSTEPLQRLNGYKNVLATIVNGVAARGLHPRRARPDRLAGRAAHRDRLDDRRGHRRRRWAAGCRRRCCAASSSSSASWRSSSSSRSPDGLAPGRRARAWPCWPAGVVQSTIGFGLAVVAAPVRRAARARPDAGRAAPAGPDPAAAPALARRPRHRLAPARLGAGGTTLFTPGRGRRRRLVLAAGDRRARRGADPRDGRALGPRHRPARDPAQRGGGRCGLRRLGHGGRDRRPVPRPRAAARAPAAGALDPRGVLRRGVAAGARRAVPRRRADPRAGGRRAASGCRSACSATPCPRRCGRGSTRRSSGARCSPSACSPASPSSPGPRWPSLAGVPTPIDDPADPRLTDYVGLTDVALRRRSSPSGGSTSRSRRRSSAGRWQPGTGRART